MATYIIDAIRELYDQKNNEFASISEKVIYQEIKGDIILNSAHYQKSPSADASGAIADYYMACRDNNVLLKDDIHSDIIDVFRWHTMQQTLFECRKDSSSYVCGVKSYFNMKQILHSTANGVNTDFCISETEDTLKVPINKLTQDVNEVILLLNEKKYSIISLLYNIVYEKMWDETIEHLHHIPDGEFIATHIRSLLPFMYSQPDELGKSKSVEHLCTTVKRMYPNLSVKDMCEIYNTVTIFCKNTTSVKDLPKSNGKSYFPWLEAVFNNFSKLCNTDAEVVDKEGDAETISFSAIFAELDKINHFDNEAAIEAASRNEIETDKEAKKIAKKAQRDEDKEHKQHQRVQKYNDTKNNISNAWTKFKNKEEAIDNQLDKITRGLKDIVFDTNSKKTREDVIQGGKHWTPIQVLGRVLIGYGVFSWSKIGAIALLVTRHYTRKNCTKQERRKAIVELEHEIKIVEEKINDAQANGDQKAKYALMRTKNSLESSLDQIRHSYKKMPDAELKGAKKALINVEVNGNGNDK